MWRSGRQAGYGTAALHLWPGGGRALLCSSTCGPFRPLQYNALDKTPDGRLLLCCMTQGTVLPYNNVWKGAQWTCRMATMRQ